MYLFVFINIYVPYIPYVHRISWMRNTLGGYSCPSHHYQRGEFTVSLEKDPHTSSAELLDSRNGIFGCRDTFQ